MAQGMRSGASGLVRLEISVRGLAIALRVQPRRITARDPIGTTTWVIHEGANHQLAGFGKPGIGDCWLAVGFEVRLLLYRCSSTPAFAFVDHFAQVRDRANLEGPCLYSGMLRN
jgi:hypothetical protein